MLNKGDATLDKILSIERTEKTKVGLGYQGCTSSSHIVFLRESTIARVDARKYHELESVLDTDSGFDVRGRLRPASQNTWFQFDPGTVVDTQQRRAIFFRGNVMFMCCTA